MAGLPEGTHFYYVHSFAPAICEQTTAITDYGVPFSAILQNGNFFGTQFHPEKSGEAGEIMLKNFLRL
jgi:glutamine amidotransferase